MLLLNLYTFSMNSDVFLMNWRYPVVTSRHCKGSVHDLFGYRLLNHTLVIFKSVKKVVKSFIADYLSTATLLSPKQQGLLQYCSRLTCLFDFLNLPTKLANLSMAFAVTSLNTSKACFGVPHPHSMPKLSTFGNRSYSILAFVLPHGASFLLADGMKIVYLLKPNGVSSVVREICADLFVFDG